jgi:hypothetical protein
MEGWECMVPEIGFIESLQVEKHGDDVDVKKADAR